MCATYARVTGCSVRTADTTSGSVFNFTSGTFPTLPLDRFNEGAHDGDMNNTATTALDELMAAAS